MDFVDSFDDRFPQKPPNASLSSLEKGVGEYPMTLHTPTLSADGVTLTYAITPLIPEQQLPRKMGPVSLFIGPDTVTPPVTVSGKVLDNSGNAVSGAVVRVSYTYTSCGLTTCSTQPPIAGSATTDETGRYSITGGCSWGSTYYMSAAAPDQATV